jgi:hypothetical protein
MSRITIRKTGDCALIHSLDCKEFVGCHNLKDMDGELHYWLAWNEGKVVGYCATKVFDEFVFMARSVVFPEFRGLGIQKRMVDRREAFHGKCTYITYASRFNPASMNSLINCGYKTYLSDSPYGGRDAVYFQKEVV